MGHGKYLSKWKSFPHDGWSKDDPKRKRRTEDKESRTKARMRDLDIGFIQAKRSDRWAVRKTKDSLMYTLYEHLFDLAKFRGAYRGRALVYCWELAQDLGVNPATITRKIRKLEELGFIWVRRSKSDCFPTVFGLTTFEVQSNLTADIRDGE